eukprot:UN24786
MTAVEALVEYFYTGTVSKTVDELSKKSYFEFIKFTKSRYLFLERLSYLLCSRIVETLCNLQNAPEYLRLAVEYKCKDLVRVLEDYCSSRYFYYTQTVGLKNKNVFDEKEFLKIRNLHLQSITSNKRDTDPNGLNTRVAPLCYHNVQKIGKMVYVWGGGSIDGPRDGVVYILDTSSWTWGIVEVDNVIDVLTVNSGKIINRQRKKP